MQNKLVFRFPSWTRWCDGFAMLGFALAAIQLLYTHQPIYYLVLGIATVVLLLCAIGRAEYRSLIRTEMARRGSDLTNVSFE